MCPRTSAICLSVQYRDASIVTQCQLTNARTHDKPTKCSAHCLVQGRSAQHTQCEARTSVTSLLECYLESPRGGASPHRNKDPRVTQDAPRAASLYN